jgi:hypothetical protein
MDLDPRPLPEYGPCPPTACRASCSSASTTGSGAIWPSRAPGYTAPAEFRQVRDLIKQKVKELLATFDGERRA